MQFLASVDFAHYSLVLGPRNFISIQTHTLTNDNTGGFFKKNTFVTVFQKWMLTLLPTAKIANLASSVRELKHSRLSRWRLRARGSRETVRE